MKCPDPFDVIVASHLLGDILSDVGPALVGSIGIAPGAYINPEQVRLFMFEPVHGSALDIASKGVAKPIGQICSGAMMLSHLGETDAARSIETAIERPLENAQASRTADLGGRSGTHDVTRAIEAYL